MEPVILPVVGGSSMQHPGRSSIAAAPAAVIVTNFRLSMPAPRCLRFVL